jgi:hypothetical protein
MGNPAEETIRHPNHCKYKILVQSVNREKSEKLLRSSVRRIQILLAGSVKGTTVWKTRTRISGKSE